MKYDLMAERMLAIGFVPTKEAWTILGRECKNHPEDVPKEIERITVPMGDGANMSAWFFNKEQCESYANKRKQVSVVPGRENNFELWIHRVANLEKTVEKLSQTVTALLESMEKAA